MTMIFLSFLTVIAFWASQGALLVVAAEVTFQTPGRPESAVASSDAFYVGQFEAPPAGTVLKYSLAGEPLALDFVGLPDGFEFASVRGLALNDASDTLWVAMDEAVVELALGGDQATWTQTFDFGSIDMMEPNGLCLSPDEASLYVTDPKSQSLAKIDLKEATFTKMFDASSTNGSSQTPNGCVVDPSGESVWLINQKHGITVFDIATNTVGLTETWSQNIMAATASSERLVGDGIVYYGGSIYTSIWEVSVGAQGIQSSGTIFKCQPGSECTEYEPKVAADLQLDLKTTPDQPQLILPNLVTRTVETLPIPAAASSNEVMPTAAPTMSSATTSAPTSMPTASDAVALAPLKKEVSFLMMAGFTAVAVLL